MKNRADLSLRYVMWGQRIWEKASDSEKSWEKWSYQSCTKIKNCVKGDRGDNTANHWYVDPMFPSLEGAALRLYGLEKDTC